MMQCPNGHGEFDPMRGCPQCMAELHEAGAKEREEEIFVSGAIGEEARKEMEYQNIDPDYEAAMADRGTNIVKIKYWNDAKGEPTGRDYSFYTEDLLAVGDYVQVPTEHGAAKALVTAVNVPENEILAFKDRVKTIPSGSIRPPVNPNLNVAYGGYELNGEYVGPPDLDIAAAREAAEEPPPQAIVDHINDAAEIGPPEQDELEKIVDNWNMPSALVTIENQIGQPVPELFQLYQEAAGLLRVAKDRVITTNADLKPATDDLVIIATCKKAMNARKSELIRPLKAKWELVNKCFNDLMSPVLEADQITRGKVKQYNDLVRQRAAEAARIEAEKYKLAQEEAAFNQTGEFDVPLDTVQAPPPVPEHTRTQMGTLGGRIVWKARVVDFKLLPDEYKLPNEKLLNSFAATNKGTREIPGVEFYTDDIVTVRNRQ